MKRSTIIKTKKLALVRNTVRALSRPELIVGGGTYCMYVTDLQGGATCGRSQCERPRK